MVSGEFAYLLICEFAYFSQISQIFADLVLRQK